MIDHEAQQEIRAKFANGKISYAAAIKKFEKLAGHKKAIPHDQPAGRNKKITINEDTAIISLLEKFGGQTLRFGTIRTGMRWSVGKTGAALERAKKAGMVVKLNAEAGRRTTWYEIKPSHLLPRSK